ncbi:MAG: bifunctional diaminohydroxyphosphoribosylaminopyrimidine deaminase/5-amino-6-(5-phosphoribosylamino)uracil reductase RibD [Bacteroidota bacterium]|nr:bifunctional diaminohydroxyphosphoribosylaminopyrimidine deaminase/5-amino-6-(5-phosphoribosylamino)uracil reductase RibD [Bacteroidota bacterium]
MHNHSFFIQKCLNLALKGFPHNSPNPMVGSIIVYNGKIIGKGYHEKYGSYHAEVNAINSVKDLKLLKRSTLYVNLEPCAHVGKTPPCSDLIIKHKIPKVVIGCLDTFSEVSGRGIAKMKKEGIEVICGVLERESRELNKRFFTFHEKKRPYIILKWAESKDRFIAPKNQKKPFWITSSQSKKLVHKWRNEEDAILIGRTTAEKDNPLLTVRDVNGKNPIRIIIDSKLKLKSHLNIFNNDSETIIINSLKDDIESNIKFMKLNFNNSIENILNKLHESKIQSVIIEGGSKTLKSFIDRKIWDEARIFTAKKILYKGLYAPKIHGKVISNKKIKEDMLKIIVNA